VGNCSKRDDVSETRKTTVKKERFQIGGLRITGRPRKGSLDVREVKESSPTELRGKDKGLGRGPLKGPQKKAGLVLTIRSE